jgi:hypothetical protein
MEFDCATDPTLVRTKWSLTAPTLKSVAQIFDCQNIIFWDFFVAQSNSI